ncbi:major facilitator superfamily transporter [Ophiostoma piceae UAMH 11346]|uniref:Major facilitator superfamily transporter n=1 Tax=Ophiostoma piceae (strain UAMH 11346) TaxID=1262450 RepID=S3C4C1_OPHP1|nr:major facilitator superfamily transporter [Ophiostoma piceae UAMH 11346]
MAGQTTLAAEPDERSPLLVNQQAQPGSSATSTTSISKNSDTVVHVRESSSGDSNAPSYTDSVSTDTSLLRDIESEAATGQPSKDHASFGTLARVVLVLMIGVFVSNADGSLMLATHPVIASEFNDLESSSWLFAGFVLASAATQTMYGKLSDIYGRKNLILVSYIIFALGCALVGVGQSMFQVILGRVISGAGGSGMTALVSILISDLLPIRDVASWRAYINIAATTGRSLGGPAGGWLADVIGWRWSFIGQVPLMLIAVALCQIYLPSNAEQFKGGKRVEPDHSVSSWERLKSVDFLGSLLLALTLLTLLMPMEIGGSKVPWSSPIIPALFGVGVILFFFFLRTERRAIEPVVPLEIFSIRDANLSIFVQMTQLAAQLGLMFSVPLYFKASASVSNTEAGAHLFPAVAGNAIGGIIAGIYIKRTGRYRNLIILAAFSASLSYFSLLVSWHGHTNWFQSLYIAPGGFGSGLIQSAVFVSLQVVVKPHHMAPAISLLYLSGTCAMILGLACVSTVMHEFLKSGLESNLAALALDPADRAEIFQNALSNIEYISTLAGDVKTAVVRAYVDSLWWSHTVSLAFSSVALFASFFIGEKPLGKSEPLPQAEQLSEEES